MNSLGDVLAVNVFFFLKTVLFPEVFTSLKSKQIRHLGQLKDFCFYLHFPCETYVGASHHIIT